jgi:hypothetical protein
MISCGQLGLGHTNTVFVPTVISVPLAEATKIIGMASGCLSMHSFVFTTGIPIARPALCSVQLSTIVNSTQKLKICSGQGGVVGAAGPVISQSAVDAAGFENTVAIRHLREYIDTAFSSISVLNASFRRGGGGSGNDGIPGGGLSIQLESVRLCYSVIFNTNNQALLATLGRATLALSGKLIECPFDDPENLSVFLIVLENPLLLEPDKFYVAVERVFKWPAFQVC